MHRFVCTLSILLLVLSAAPRAKACSCPPPPPPKQALKQAAAVFSGKVLSVEIDQRKGIKMVTIEVASVWKGGVGRKATVYTAQHGATCGYGFKKDQSYLVYCYARKQKDEKKPAKLWTNIRTRTRPMANAAADMNALGKGAKPAESKIH